MSTSFSRQERYKIILHGYKNSIPLKDIARHLGTTVNCVKVQAYQYGITAKYTKQRAGRTLGIRVPDHLLEDWYRLTKMQHFRAKEAAEILGLL